MRKFNRTVALILVALMLSSCGGSSQGIESVVGSPEPTPKENKVNLKVKESIKRATLAYVAYNCTPKYFTNVTDFGDGIKTRIKNMEVLKNDDRSVSGNPDYIDIEYALNDNYLDSTYGNLVSRTTFLAIAYHQSLAGLYSYIYDIHSSKLKSLRKDYARFKLIADTAGKKLCPIEKQSSETVVLDETVVSKVQPIYDELASSWPGFKTWWAAANQLQENVSANIAIGIKDAMVPKCDEYPTADGKYVVVKCTVPPG